MSDAEDDVVVEKSPTARTMDWARYDPFDPLGDKRKAGKTAKPKGRASKWIAPALRKRPTVDTKTIRARPTDEQENLLVGWGLTIEDLWPALIDFQDRHRSEHGSYPTETMMRAWARAEHADDWQIMPATVAEAVVHGVFGARKAFLESQGEEETLKRRGEFVFSLGNKLHLDAFEPDELDEGLESYMRNTLAIRIPRLGPVALDPQTDGLRKFVLTAHIRITNARLYFAPRREEWMLELRFLRLKGSIPTPLKITDAKHPLSYIYPLVVEIFAEHDAVAAKRLSTKEILRRLKRRGHDIDARTLAKAVDASSRPRQLRIGGKNTWGYLREDFVSDDEAALEPGVDYAAEMAPHHRKWLKRTKPRA